MAVVRGAEDFLHFLHGWINRLAKRRREAVGKHLHGITQPLAGDADLVEVVVIAEVGRDDAIQLVKQLPKHEAGQVQQGAVAAGIAHCRHGSRGQAGQVHAGRCCL